ncbi:hypothetical protein MGALJ_09860 [Mycobacterium gallinarum]|uniref:DNA-binding phage zinc finger domain-containing protein n=1 Tax=Mycobacterium gallinarum TaxID=39689 RepID=A0A9W4FDR2_9MYCO|nr:hypothetical protein MGALJ_09860 [Mycobacterium gallinarum]
MPDQAPEGGNTGLAGGRPATGDAALQIECPQCGAQPGQPCTIRRYRGPDARHRARIEAFEAAAADPANLPPPWPGRDTFELVCMRCGQLITAQRPGYAAVDRHAAMRRTAALALWRAEHGVAGPHMPPLRWRLVHSDCDKVRRQARGDARIRAQDLRTTRRLLRMSAALTTRRWVADTDWRALVAYIIRGSAVVESNTAAARRHADAAENAAKGGAAQGSHG